MSYQIDLFPDDNQRSQLDLLIESFIEIRNSALRYLDYFKYVKGVRMDDPQIIYQKVYDKKIYLETLERLKKPEIFILDVITDTIKRYVEEKLTISHLPDYIPCKKVGYKNTDFINIRDIRMIACTYPKTPNYIKRLNAKLYKVQETYHLTFQIEKFVYVRDYSKRKDIQSNSYYDKQSTGINEAE